MKKEKHPHSALIDAIGKTAVCKLYRLGPTTLHSWRVRGIPHLKRISFAKLAAMNGVAVPPDFFDGMK